MRMSTVAALYSVFLPSAAFSASLDWQPAGPIDTYNCSDEGISELIITKKITLIHPDDVADLNRPKKVNVYCPKLTFREGGEITSVSDLNIRIGDMIAGPVRIVSTRGSVGKDGPDTPDIWKQIKMKSMVEKGPASDGKGPDDCLRIPSRGSEQGSTGPRGDDGESGLLYKAPKGANGDPGGTASDIVLVARDFAPGTTIDISAIGGAGGAGNQGGRGADGGDGGKGGRGGKGGGANTCHMSSRGGTGGPGGDGGHGGNGGPGGDGGDGGNGGTVTLVISERARKPVAVIANGGGEGGAPGLGGDRGEGGLKGLGGDGGDGGDGSSGLLRTNLAKGNDGNGGNPGADGQPGLPGPAGLPGDDGQDGRIGDTWQTTVPNDVLNSLLNATN